MERSGFLFPDSDPDQSQNIMGFKLDHDSSSVFFHEVSSSSVCVIC